MKKYYGLEIEIIMVAKQDVMSVSQESSQLFNDNDDFIGDFFD